MKGRSKTLKMRAAIRKQINTVNELTESVPVKVRITKEEKTNKRLEEAFHAGVRTGKGDAHQATMEAMDKLKDDHADEMQRQMDMFATAIFRTGVNVGVKMP